MTAATAPIDQLAERIEQVATASHHLDPGQWVSAGISGIVDRYRCDAPERCESRPAWDAAYDEMMEALFPKADVVLEEAFDKLAKLASEALGSYLAAWPDARLAQPEPVTAPVRTDQRPNPDTSKGAMRPTPDEIRAALTRSIGEGFEGLDDDTVMLRVVIDSDMARTRMPWAEDFTPGDDHPGTLWADLRPEEADELETVMHAVLREVQQEATAMLLERSVAAALAFAERHPDIPRGHYPLVPEHPDAPIRATGTQEAA